MPVRTILDIEIDDSAFQAFQEKFNAYQSQLKELPAEWARVSQTMAGLSGIMDRLNVASRAGPGNAMLVGKIQIDTKKIAADYAILWTGISKSSHFFLRDVIGAHHHLTKWTALTGVFAGLLGAGGLFGISRMAMHAAGQRQSAMGLGVTTGEMSSFLVNVGTLTSDPSGLLSRFSEGFYGRGAQSDFAAAFGSGIGSRMQGKDAASFFADILPDLKRKLDTIPEAQLGNYLKSSHLANRGIDTEMARNIRAMSVADVGTLSQRLGADAAAMNMPDEATKALQDLDTKLLETWNILSTDIENKLTPLTPSLTKFTDSFGKFAEKALDEGGAFDVLLKEVGDDIDWLAGELGTSEGRGKLLDFVKDAGIAALTFEVLAKAISGAMAISSAYGAWRMIAGVLTWVPVAAAAAALGATIMPQPLNVGEDERARQRQFGTGAASGPRTQTPGSAGGGITPSQNERAATSGTGARTQTPGGPGSSFTPVSMTGDFEHPRPGAKPHEYTDTTLENDKGIAPEFQQRLDAYFKAHPEYHVVSGFRSFERQKQLYEASRSKGHMVARPGHSFHNKGIAADLGRTGGGGLEGKPLPDLEKYGLWQSMPWEPWHVEPLRHRHKDGTSPHASLGMHPIHVALMHRKPSVEIAMDGPGNWSVS